MLLRYLDSGELMPNGAENLFLILAGPLIALSSSRMLSSDNRDPQFIDHDILVKGFLAGYGMIS